MFSTAYDSGLQPQDFVDDIHKKKKKIVGIGHDRFTVKNPDKRVLIIKDYVSQKFPAKPMVEFALEVEKITTSKKEGLILNIDGIIACAFVDMLKNSGHFSEEEAEKFISLGALNGIFALGRSIGLIGTIFVFFLIKSFIIIKGRYQTQIPTLSTVFSILPAFTKNEILS